MFFHTSILPLQKIESRQKLFFETFWDVSHFLMIGNIKTEP